MALIDDKKKVFGDIAALRTLNEGFPKLNLSNSLPSINNDANSLDFLIDLLKTLIGYEQLRDSIVDVITYNLSDIELEIKKALKNELKSIVSCSVNPSIPSFINYAGTGVNIKVDKVDFLNIMRVDPTSIEGKFLYDDISSGLNSEDFNTYLFNTIQNENTEQNWGDVTTPNDILTVKFIKDTGTDTNILNIKASPYYSTASNGKTLTDLNNDYIDSIQLFGSEKMISNIIDGLFGTLSSVLNKSQKQLENEEKINNVIESIVNLDDTTVLSDNFFEFSNEELQNIENTARNRKNGIRMLKGCDEVVSSIPISSLDEMANNLSGTSTQIEVKSVIQTSIDNMSDISAINEENLSDKFTVKLNFIELLIRRLMLSIANFIVSPKVIVIFLMNYKILYGQDEEYTDAIDFIKKNKSLIRSIVNKIRDLIIKILLKIVLKEITELIAKSVVKNNIEKSLNDVSQLLSLVGVPQEIIRRITNLT